MAKDGGELTNNNSLQDGNALVLAGRAKVPSRIEYLLYSSFSVLLKALLFLVLSIAAIGAVWPGLGCAVAASMGHTSDGWLSSIGICSNKRLSEAHSHKHDNLVESTKADYFYLVETARSINRTPAAMITWELTLRDLAYDVRYSGFPECDEMESALRDAAELSQAAALQLGNVSSALEATVTKFAFTARTLKPRLHSLNTVKPPRFWNLAPDVAGDEKSIRQEYIRFMDTLREALQVPLFRLIIVQNTLTYLSDTLDVDLGVLPENLKETNRTIEDGRLRIVSQLFYRWRGNNSAQLQVYTQQQNLLGDIDQSRRLLLYSVKQLRVILDNMSENLKTLRDLASADHVSTPLLYRHMMELADVFQALVEGAYLEEGAASDRYTDLLE